MEIDVSVVFVVIEETRLETLVANTQKCKRPAGFGQVWPDFRIFAGPIKMFSFDVTCCCEARMWLYFVASTVYNVQFTSVQQEAIRDYQRQRSTSGVLRDPLLYTSSCN